MVTAEAGSTVVLNMTKLPPAPVAGGGSVGGDEKKGASKAVVITGGEGWLRWGWGSGSWELRLRRRVSGMRPWKKTPCAYGATNCDLTIGDAELARTRFAKVSFGALIAAGGVGGADDGVCAVASLHEE